MTDRLHSYLIPFGTRQCAFRAPIVEWLGVVPGPTGAVILARCSSAAQEPKPHSGLLNAQGHPVAVQASDAPEWTIYVRMDGEEPPEDARYLGGLVICAQDNLMAGVFIFVALEAPKEAE